MKKTKFLFLAIFFLIYGCSTENPKTENLLLKNKKISWSGNKAEYFEFLPDGSLIACGGDFAQEGYMAGEWESAGGNGNFKIVEKKNGSGDYFLATVDGIIAKGSKLLFEYHREAVENKNAFENMNALVTIYEEIINSHEKSAISSKATATVSRFKDDIFVLELKVDDLNGKIKKVFTEGDAITTEVMVTNGKRWSNNPPILISGQWDGLKPVYSKITILYHDGREEIATFQTSGYVDNSGKTFEDAWF